MIMKKSNISHHTDSMELGEIRDALIKIEAKDIGASKKLQHELQNLKKEKRDTFYSDLIFTLIAIRHSEHEARLIWVNLLSHKWEMSEKLGRNVGIRVAAFDYFKNIRKELNEVTIVETSRFIETTRLAIHDSLTDLYNHRFFQDELRETIQKSKRNQTSFCLFMFDIDHFKKYNDINGHIAGDIALREVSKAAVKTLRETDIAARYGGEEFVIIFNHSNKEEVEVGSVWTFEWSLAVHPEKIYDYTGRSVNRGWPVVWFR